MNHYPHHIGDFNNATRHLSRIERSVYRDAIELYYDTESPLPADDFEWLCRRLLCKTAKEINSLRFVLENFFFLIDGQYHHNRCDEEIAKYRANADKARENGKRGGRPKKTQPVISGLATETQKKANQEPEPEPSKPKEANASSSPDGDLLQTDLIDPNPEGLTKAEPLACPVQRIVDLYHQHMPENPKVKVMNAQRTSTIKSRWREAAQLRCQPFGYSNVADGLTAWAEFFEICASSPWLTGKVPPSPGRTQFIADIDYLMSPSGFTKCLENKFHRRAA